MTPNEKAKLERAAAKRPLGICVGQKQGHLVGIPPRLRDFRDQLFDLMPQPVQVAVEIGTLQGWFAWRCMKYLPKTAQLFCIDPFLDNPEEGWDGEYNFKCWKKNLTAELGKRIFLKRGASFDEAKKWGDGVKIDFLFIDGDHRMENVVFDLVGWGARVRPGGLIAGHDIDGKHGKAVKEALEYYCPKNGIDQVHVGKVYSFTGVQVTNCWWFYKPEPEEEC